MGSSSTAVTNRVLDIDLTSGSIDEQEISGEDRRRYLGGKGLALKLLFDTVAPGTEPFSAESALVMMSGPTAGTKAPAGGRFVVAGKSPLTGIFASSVVGGRFGVSLKRAGYDGVMIRGKAASPVVVRVDDKKAVIEDAKGLWGKDTYEVQEKGKKDGDWVVIGPAGENLVHFAAICAGNRFAGRAGLGAVMGSKNLKGIVAKGTGKVAPADPRAFEKALALSRKKVKAHYMTGENLPELGTPGNVMVYGSSGIMPVRNFSRTSFDRVQEISGEYIREHHYVKNHGCVGCPIQCGRMGRYGKKELVSPEYETIALMGSNLMIGDISDIARWNDLLNRLGLDTISTGSVIGYVMEMTERGRIKSGLSFGHPEGIDQIIEDIAYRRDLGAEMADGVRKLSETYGGTECAIQVKGLEMAAYDPRGCSGQGLGFATANRGACHLSGSTHAIEVGSYLAPHGTKGKAHFVKFMQDLTDAVNSAIFCIQTEYPFLEENFAYKNTPLPVMQLLMRNLPGIAIATTDLSDYCKLLSGLMGYKITRSDFYTVGERIFTLERHMNCREGISKKDDTLPARLLTEVREDGWPKIELERMLDRYYALRGWDHDGRPTEKLLNKLKVA
jgi:aldehyde:ferredoxin oxidoreductase